jgi:hypothetical protein
MIKSDSVTELASEFVESLYLAFGKGGLVHSQGSPLWEDLQQRPIGKMC